MDDHGNSSNPLILSGYECELLVLMPILGYDFPLRETIDDFQTQMVANSLRKHKSTRIL